MEFNLAQLATWEEARLIAVKLSAGPIVVGGGVAAETSNPATSGIYIPEWLSGPANFEQPNYTDPKTGVKYYHIHFRFRNGAEGMNAGLIREQFKRYPTSEGYVLRSLAAEADALAGQPRWW